RAGPQALNVSNQPGPVRRRVGEDHALVDEYWHHRSAPSALLVAVVSRSGGSAVAAWRASTSARLDAPVVAVVRQELSSAVICSHQPRTARHSSRGLASRARA